MYPIDLVKYTNTKKKIPSNELSSVTPEATYDGVFKSYLQDGAILLWGSCVLGQLMLIQFSAFVTGPLQAKFLTKLPVYATTSLMYAPVFALLYFGFSYHLNHGQSFGQFKNKKRINFKKSNFKTLFRYSVFSSIASSFLGLPFLSKKFTTWFETTAGVKFEKNDDLYHSLFIPKNEWAPSLIEMTLPELPVMETQEDEYYANVA